jgi:plastocyanin
VRHGIRRLVPLAAVAGTVAAAAAAPAAAMPMGGEQSMVTILGTTFAPGHTDVLAGETVMWHNDSVLRHTVTAADGGFRSKQLFGGEMYEHRFGAVGDFTYYCTVHPFMHGEVDVHRVLLDAPSGPGGPGRPYPLTGRAALPEGTDVAIERDAGAGFVLAGSATVDADGAFTAVVRAGSTASYRAVAGGDASPAVRVLIVDRRVTARAHRGTVSVRVTPASPHATVVLQLRLRDRFGWWPVARHHLDRHSRTRFAVRGVGRRVRARAVLTLRDGATRLARSRVLRVRPRR